MCGNDRIYGFAEEFGAQVSAGLVVTQHHCQRAVADTVSRDTGVIHMRLLNIIRQIHLRQKLSIREIARRMGLSRDSRAGNSSGMSLRMAVRSASVSR